MSACRIASRSGPRIGAVVVLALGLAACSILQGQPVEEEPTPTLTPAPTETPLPTETPEPTVEPTVEPPPEPPQARIFTTTATNVRSGPSPDCAIIGSYPASTEVEVRAQTLDHDWWRVPYEDTEGWVFAQNTMPVTDVSQVPEEPAQGCAAASGGSGAGATSQPPGDGSATVTQIPTVPVIGPVETWMSPTYDAGDVPGIIDCIANPAACGTLLPPAP